MYPEKLTKCLFVPFSGYYHKEEPIMDNYVPLHTYPSRSYATQIIPHAQEAYRQIDGIANGWYEDFEQQRRNIGDGERTKKEIILKTKEGIHALKNGDVDRLFQCLSTAQSEFNRLRSLHLPQDLLWTYLADAGGELVEFYYFAFYAYRVFGKDVGWHQLPTLEQMGVTPQAFLAGLADVPGELARLLADTFVERDITTYDKYILRVNLITCAQAIYQKLDQYAEVYGRVIDNSRRRDWGSKYRGLIGRVRSVILNQQDMAEQLRNIINLEFLVTEQRRIAAEQQAYQQQLTQTVTLLTTQLQTAGVIPQNQHERQMIITVPHQLHSQH